MKRSGAKQRTRKVVNQLTAARYESFLHPKPKQVPRESVDDFIARGGQIRKVTT